MDGRDGFLGSEVGLRVVVVMRFDGFGDDEGFERESSLNRNRHFLARQFWMLELGREDYFMCGFVVKFGFERI